MRQEDFLFIQNYYIFFYVILSVTFLCSLLYYSTIKINIGKTNIDIIGFLIVCGTAVYIGSRDLNVGIDTSTYSSIYSLINLGRYEFGQDYLFFGVLWIFAQLSSFQSFLMLCALIYVCCAALGFKALFPNTWFLIFLLFVISPNFFQYGINVMRNGVAASIFLLSLKWIESRPKLAILFMLISVGCHISMLLPFGAFLVSKYITDIKWPLIIWGMILLCNLCGFSFSSILGNQLRESEKLSSYLSVGVDDYSLQLLNFFIYSASPIFASMYYIYLKHFKEKLYIRLIVMYLLLNSIYVSVMDIQWAMRFAYLSEFLMPVLLIYPLLKERLWDYRLLKISFIFIIVFSIKAFKILF